MFRCSNLSKLCLLVSVLPRQRVYFFNDLLFMFEITLVNLATLQWTSKQTCSVLYQPLPGGLARTPCLPKKEIYIISQDKRKTIFSCMTTKNQIPFTSVTLPNRTSHDFRVTAITSQFNISFSTKNTSVCLLPFSSPFTIMRVFYTAVNHFFIINAIDILQWR